MRSTCRRWSGRVAASSLSPCWHRVCVARVAGRAAWPWFFSLLPPASDKTADGTGGKRSARASASGPLRSTLVTKRDSLKTGMQMPATDGDPYSGEAIEAYEAVRGPDGKVDGGKD